MNPELAVRYSVENDRLKQLVTGTKEISTLHPDLPLLISAMIGQSSGNPALVDILEGYATKASYVRRVAAGAIKAGKLNAPTQKDKVEDTILGRSAYPRPNGAKYYSRPWGEHEDVVVLRAARDKDKAVLFYGAPGCGKTALVEGAFGEDLFTVLGSGDTEVADLVGGYTQNPEGGWRWTDGPLIKAAEAGLPLLIDEVGLIDPKVLSIVYGLMDGRREYTVTANPDRGTVKAKQGFFVIGATNPNAPGVRLSEALLSRFALHVEMTTDWALAKDVGVSTKMVTASQNLAKKQSAGEVSWAPQFRELENFRDLEKDFGTMFAIQNILAVAPELDRPIVSDVFSRIYGEAVLPARI